jgi:AcrR family transcriptional regulator
MPENDLDRTKDRIIDAAGEIFANKGFEQATVRDICQQAGANLASVNYYFGDKQRLYIESVKAAHAWKMHHAELPAWPDDVTPEQMLGDFILTFLRQLKLGDRDTWQNRLMRREMMNSETACAELVRESIRPQFEVLLGIVRHFLPAQLSDEQLHLTAFSIVGQCLFYHFADPVVQKLVCPEEYQSQTPEALAEHVLQFSLAALGRQASFVPSH